MALGNCRVGLFGNKPSDSVDLKADGSPATVINPYANSAQLTVAVSPQENTKACSGVFWTVTANEDWLKVQGNASFGSRGSATLQASAEANTGAARTGSFTITATPSPTGSTLDVYKTSVVVNQAGT